MYENLAEFEGFEFINPLIMGKEDSVWFFKWKLYQNKITKVLS